MQQEDILSVLCLRMLATRIAELEHKLRVLEISGLWSGGGGLELTWEDGGGEGILASSPGFPRHQRFCVSLKAWERGIVWPKYGGKFKFGEQGLWWHGSSCTVKWQILFWRETWCCMETQSSTSL